ncbi:acetylxylan esterase a [Diplodia corticola]|uniref:Carboxylic ester hydrolase n=1 Tax=Diplodia corticola TaxID=236234 RepID=A0A1J9S5R6_9PEZI|nr:acetylxylan esterase a [Diplodia corticola]OJD34957.1 acetylxylan esterase a [Diplodia corticola]
MAMFGLLLVLAIALLSACTDAVAGKKEKRASLQLVPNYGDNPAGVPMYVYVPDNLADNPGIVVAIHYCTGTAQAYYSGSPYATLAERYGFVVIYPNSPHDGTCWDVSSQATLTHNGGGDSNSIANMVTWAIDEFSANSSKVFVTGSSSGAMMTNVLAATYPSLFAAGIAYSGVPAGCFLSTANAVDAWNSTCANGLSVATPTQWADVARAMYPTYASPRPRMQVYHGSADELLKPPNYAETLKQWVGVAGLDWDNPSSKEEGQPVEGYWRTRWNGEDGVVVVEGVWAEGVGHTVPIRGDDDMVFFGLAE